MIRYYKADEDRDESYLEFIKEEANNIAKEIISKHLTYEEAENIFGIPKSTIYEMVHSNYIDSNLSMKLI